MFGLFKKKQLAPSSPEPMVKVYLNPLVSMLIAGEKQKGAPLTEAEVLEIRDTTVAVEMPASKAKIFYASLDAQVPVHRISPENIWQEWQEIRMHLE
jgi:hypothetical protein